jgi:hypothetical protein
VEGSWEYWEWGWAVGLSHWARIQGVAMDRGEGVDIEQEERREEEEI